MNSLEKEMLEKIKRGDKKAFELVYKKYYSLLCVYAYDLLRDHILAEEIVQETFIKIWESKSKIEISTSLHSYLYKSIHNQCVNAGKHLLVIKALVEKYSEDAIYEAELLLIADSEFAMDNYLYEGLELDVKDAIQSLPEQCRKIFMMNRYEDLSYTKIAQKLDLSINTIKTQMGRALDKIRIYLENKIK